MARIDQIEGDYAAALAALDWQVDLGIDAAVQDTAVNRYEVAAAPPVATTPPVVAVVAGAGDLAGVPVGDAVAAATAAAGRAGTLAELRAEMAAFAHCDIKQGARNLVFADGNPGARVLILGEAPGRTEDTEGRPFVGPAGALLDRMFAAIGLARDAADPRSALYITNILPWRPPGDRDPTPEELAMMRPFVARHIALADPEIIVSLGNVPLLSLTGETGILRNRGAWREALGRPLLPMVHPAYLFRNPLAKRESWADLLALKARLGTT